MIEQDLDPSQFIISKDFAASSHNRPIGIGPLFYDYTVFIDGEQFTVPQPSDLRFLDFFAQRCLAPEEADDNEAASNSESGRPNLLTRMVNWLNQPI